MFFIPKRYQAPVLWVWLEVFFIPKRYQTPVLWVWLEVFFIPKRYQTTVFWVWLEVFFIPKRYQTTVFWVWLEVFFVPKRYQAPILWAWLQNCISPLRGTNYQTTHFDIGINVTVFLSTFDRFTCAVLSLVFTMLCQSLLRSSLRSRRIKERGWGRRKIGKKGGVGGGKERLL